MPSSVVLMFAHTILVPLQDVPEFFRAGEWLIAAVIDPGYNAEHLSGRFLFAAVNSYNVTVLFPASLLHRIRGLHYAYRGNR